MFLFYYEKKYMNNIYNKNATQNNEEQNIQKWWRKKGKIMRNKKTS